MRLADRLLLKGVKVNDFRFWVSHKKYIRCTCSQADIVQSASPEQPLSRMLRDLQFPCDQVDTIDPYLLSAHQGFVEDVFLKDMLERGFDVARNLTFVDYHPAPYTDGPMEVVCESTFTHDRTVVQTRYLIGCDGAHSNVGRAMGVRQVGGTKGEVWAVIDGVLETDFPDIYSKTVVHSKDGGTAVLFPRERNMTRLYIALKSESGEETSMQELSQEYAMQRAAEIFEPYTLKWRSLEWFGRHQIGHRTASKFLDNIENGKVFLAGDAAHTHSPLSYGMNTSIADAWNLAWKLNLSIRGLSKVELLGTYEDERRQVADNLLDFDQEQVNSMLSGDSLGFAENSIRNARFASGYGADYAPNLLNVPQKGSILGQLRVGSIPPAAKVSRLVDSTPVDLQVDIPMLGQFRIFFFTRTLDKSMDFLAAVSTHILTDASVLGRATRATNSSYALQPPVAAPSDDFIRPERYTTVSGLFTFGIVLRMRTEELEIADLPALWRESKFTVYLDDVPHLDTRGMTATEKWLGGCSGSEVNIVVIRPDGVVGTMYRGRGTLDHAVKACQQLDSYFQGFLNV
jgi:phenol 2-monooxygenase